MGDFSLKKANVFINYNEVYIEILVTSWTIIAEVVKLFTKLH